MHIQITAPFWLPVILARLASAEGATCYNAFGNPIIYDVEACNPSASGTAGSHSACCNVPKQDVCLSSGLCLATWATGRDQMLWVGGCTDSTWQDPACWNLCVGDAGDKATSYSLTSCSNNTWCCDGHFDFQADQGSPGDCCQKAFTMSGGIGTAVRQIATSSRATTRSTTGSTAATPTSPNPTSNGGNGPAPTSAPNSSAGGASSTGDGSNSKTVAIVGGVLGAALAASLVAVGVLGFSNWKLRRQITGAAAATGTATTSTGEYDDSKSSPPIRHGWPGIPHTATELSATDRTPELDASHRGALRAR